MYDDELPNAKSCFKESANQRYKNVHMNTNPVRIPFLEHSGEQSAFFMWISTGYLQDAATLKSFR